MFCSESGIVMPYISYHPGRFTISSILTSQPAIPRLIDLGIGGSEFLHWLILGVDVSNDTVLTQWGLKVRMLELSQRETVCDEVLGYSQ